MPFYESTFIVRQDVSSQQVENLAATLAQLVAEHGGTVAKTEHWGLKTLAYRIKKNRKGHYVMFGLDAPSAAISEFERNLRINEDVLRYMTIRVDSLETTTPSVMMQSRQARDDRRGGRGGEDRHFRRSGFRREGGEEAGPAEVQSGDNA